MNPENMQSERPAPITDVAFDDYDRHKMEHLERCSELGYGKFFDMERERVVALEENKAMREAIKEAHEMIAEHVEVLDWPALNARKLITALAKLQPFLA